MFIHIGFLIQVGRFEILIMAHQHIFLFVFPSEIAKVKRGTSDISREEQDSKQSEKVYMSLKDQKQV